MGRNQHGALRGRAHDRLHDRHRKGNCCAYKKSVDGFISSLSIVVYLVEHVDTKRVKPIGLPEMPGEDFARVGVPA